MKLNEDKVPATLDEAIEELYNALSPEEAALIRKPESSPAQFHFSVGMALRNDLSLWQKDTPLSLDMQKRFGLVHADDASGLLMHGLWAKVRGEDVAAALEKEAAGYREHWRREGIDPLTQEPIGD